MSIQKRRVVYMTDEEWEVTKRQASVMQMTASAYLRSLAIGGRLIPNALRDQTDPLPDHVLTPKEAQAERDAILRRIAKGGR